MESFYFIVALLMMVAGSPCVMTYDIKDYRLFTNDRPNIGIVGVYTAEEKWGLICMDDWSFELASAVCENLKFPGTSRYLDAMYFVAAGDEWLTSVTKNTSIYYHSCTILGNNVNCDLYTDQDCELDRIRAVTCKEPGYRGCFKDHGFFSFIFDRVFSNGSIHYNNLTVDLCINTCKERGFFFAGVEYAYECYCGRQDEKNDTSIVSDKDCDSVCNGDNLESCGGQNRIAIYEVNLGVCEVPNTLSDGFMFGDSFRYGRKVFFNCSDGFILEGPDVIQCVKPNVTGGQSLTGGQHDVEWNRRPPNCTEIMSATSSTKTTDGGAVANPTSSHGIGDAGNQGGKGDMNIIYISIGIVFAIVIIIVVIIVLVIHKRHNKRKAARLGADGHATDNNVASRNDGNGGGIPLMPRHDDEDLFELSALASRTSTAEGNHYDNEGDPLTHSGSADISPITREGFGYESIRLPAESSPLMLGEDPEGGVSVEGATDLYANTDFHEVPSNMIENELYG